MRIFAYVGGAGYVGVGLVTAPMIHMAELIVDVDGKERRFIDLPDCPAVERDRALLADPDLTEYAVPVRWLAQVPVEEAFYEPGLRAQQLPCRLYHTATIDAVERVFGLEASR